MGKAKKVFRCMLITLVIWAISRFVPALVGVLFPNSVIQKMAALIIMLPVGWYAADRISKGRCSLCIRVNMYIFAVVEVTGISEVLTYISQNWSYTGRYTMDVNGIAYSDYLFIFGGIILFEIVYAAFCVYLAKRTTVAINQESTPTSETVEVNTERIEVSEADKPTQAAKPPKQRYCKYCGGAIDSESRKCTKCGKQYFRPRIKKPIVLGALAILAILGLAILNVYQFNRYQTDSAKLENQIAELTSTIQEQEAAIEKKDSSIQSKMTEITKLKTENAKLNEKNYLLSDEIRFYDKHIVFVNNDGSRLYHKYDCVDFGDCSFWAYNIEAVDGYGYKPCSKCCK